MMETKRIYPSTQLVVSLDAKVLKVLMWILGWQSQGGVKYYAKQFAKACKMEEDEAERCVQSLVDAKLVDVSRVDDKWLLNPNAEQIQKYYTIPIAKVLEGNGIGIADKATWCDVNAVVTAEPSTVDDMSEADMKKMLLMIQAKLKEREQVKKMIVNEISDDLPY